MAIAVICLQLAGQELLHEDAALKKFYKKTGKNMLKHKSQVISTLMIGTSMAAIDGSIVNVSLPLIQREFDVPLDEVSLIITAYMITFMLFIPLTNWLKNRIGYYHLYLGSISLFTIGSLLCGLSGDLPSLTLARVVQAIGGGAIAPTSLAILSETFPKEERGSAIGWWGIGNVMGPALGPTLGGVLTEYFGWESIFYVNIPIGIITVLMATRFLRFLKNRPRTRPRLDIKGYLLFAGFVLLLQYTLTTASSRFGFLSWPFLFGVIVTCIVFWRFLRSARRPDPLLDLTVFRAAAFNRAFIIVAIRSLALFGGMFFLPFLLQGLLGYTAIQSALLILPNALVMLLTRPVAGKMADKGMIRQVSLLGIILLSVSFVLFARIDTGTAALFIVLAMVIRGLGISLLISPVSTALLNAVTPAQTASATSLNSLVMQLSGSVGIALSSALHTYIYDYYTGRHHTHEVAEHYALQDGFLFTAALILLTLIPASKLPQKVSIRRLRSKVRAKQAMG